MNDTERAALNDWLATKLDLWVHGKLGETDHGVFMGYKAPDFCGSWEAMGMLFNAMRANGWVWYASDAHPTGERWSWWKDGRRRRGVGPTLPEAVALATKAALEVREERRESDDSETMPSLRDYGERVDQWDVDVLEG